MSLDIHPICEIDEKAIIDFIFVWFIPIIAPIKAFIVGMITNTYRFDFIINTIIDNGANFCHVDIIMHAGHDIDDITAGNHMWHGAIPSLIIIDISNAVIGRLATNILHHKAEEVISMILDPSVWARKYLSIASDSWNLDELFIIGINVIMLISNATQVISQLLLDMDIEVLRNRMKYISELNGEMFVYMKI